MNTAIIFQNCKRCGKTFATANPTGARNPVGVLCEVCATPEEKHECAMAVIGHVAAIAAPIPPDAATELVREMLADAYHIEPSKIHLPEDAAIAAPITPSLVYYIRVPRCGCTFERRGATTYYLLHRVNKCAVHRNRNRAYRADEIRGLA